MFLSSHTKPKGRGIGFLKKRRKLTGALITRYIYIFQLHKHIDNKRSTEAEKLLRNDEKTITPLIILKKHMWRKEEDELRKMRHRIR